MPRSSLSQFAQQSQKSCAIPATRIVASAPFVELLREMDETIATMRRALPNSDPVLHAETARDRLAKTLEEAARTDLVVSVEEAHSATKVPTSSITKMCRIHGAKIGATKIGRTWSIHLPTFSRFIDTRLN